MKRVACLVKMIRLALRLAKDADAERGNGRCGTGYIVLPSWGGGLVPFFSLVIGLLIRKRNFNIIFIVFQPSSYRPIARRWTWEHLLNLSTKLVLKISKIGVFITMSTTSSSSYAVSEADITLANRYAKLHVINQRRCDLLSKLNADEIEFYAKQFSVAAAQLAELFVDECPDFVLLPGGISYGMGIFSSIASSNGIRIISYDSGNGILLLSTDGVAAHLTDVPRTYREISVEDSEAARELAMTELGERMGGTDKFSSQIKEASGEARNVGYLILLNLVWDAAALDLESPFDGVTDWAIKTTQNLLDNTSLPITIRQHPADRFFCIGLTYNVADEIESHFQFQERVTVVRADSEINTYDLIRFATAVLPYSSTTGVEALMLGRSVLTATNCYYSKIGLCDFKKTEEEYFKQAHQLATNSEPGEGGKRSAALVYFVAQVLNWHKTNFTPNWQDMAQLVSYTSEEFEADANIKAVLDAITSATPLSTLRYQRSLY
jgi:hypothetical protein